MYHQNRGAIDSNDLTVQSSNSDRKASGVGLWVENDRRNQRHLGFLTVLKAD
jgi:hypothetical protein